MNTLGLGLTLWIAVHLFPSVAPAARQKLVARMGERGYQGAFGLLILVGLVLIVYGWRSAVPTQIYDPPGALRHPAMGLVVIGFMLMVAANFPATRVKRFIRHPQLTGVLLWAVAHLLANGDSRSLLLFSAIGAWCVVSMMTINRRDGRWQKPREPMAWGKEILIPVIGLLIAFAVVRFHQYIAGVPLIAG